MVKVSLREDNRQIVGAVVTGATKQLVIVSSVLFQFSVHPSRHSGWVLKSESQSAVILLSELIMF